MWQNYLELFDIFGSLLCQFGGFHMCVTVPFCWLAMWPQDGVWVSRPQGHVFLLAQPFSLNAYSGQENWRVELFGTNPRITVQVIMFLIKLWAPSPPKEYINVLCIGVIKKNSFRKKTGCVGVLADRLPPGKPLLGESSVCQGRGFAAVNPMAQSRLIHLFGIVVGGLGRHQRVRTPAWWTWMGNGWNLRRHRFAGSLPYYIQLCFLMRQLNNASANYRPLSTLRGSWIAPFQVWNVAHLSLAELQLTAFFNTFIFHGFLNQWASFMCKEEEQEDDSLSCSLAAAKGKGKHGLFSQWNKNKKMALMAFLAGQHIWSQRA